MAEVIGSATYEIDPRPAEAGARRVVASLKSIREAAKAITPRTFSGIERFSQMMRQLSQLSGVRSSLVSNVRMLSDALNTFRAPSAIAIRNTRTFLTLLSRSAAPSRSVANTIAGISAAMVGFRAPTTSQTSRFRDFLTALQTPVNTSNFNRIAAGLRLIGDAAERAARHAHHLNVALGTLNVRTLGATTRNLNTTARAATHFRGNFDLMHRSILNTVGALQAFTAVLGLREIVRASATLETSRLTIAAVSGNAEEAAEAFDYLVERSLELGLSLEELGRPFARFTVAAESAGYSTSEIRHAFDQLTTASRNFGLSAADTAGVIRALEQSLSKGKFMAEEVRLQLGDRLPIAMQAMARATGESTEALSEMFERGELYTDRYFMPFVDALAEMSGGQEALANTSQGLNAALQRLATGFALAADEIGRGGLNDAIKNFSDTFIEFIRSDEGVRLFQALGQTLSVVADALRFLVDHMEEFLYVLGALVALRIGRYFQDLSNFIGGAFTRNMQAMTASATAGGVQLTALGRAAIATRAALWSVFGGPIGFAVSVFVTGMALLNSRMSVAEEVSLNLERAQSLLGDTIAGNVTDMDSYTESLSRFTDEQARVEGEVLERAQAAALEALRTAAEDSAFGQDFFANSFSQLLNDINGLYLQRNPLAEMFFDLREQAQSFRNDLRSGNYESITRERMELLAGSVVEFRDAMQAAAGDQSTTALANFLEQLTASLDNLIIGTDSYINTLEEAASVADQTAQRLEILRESFTFGDELLSIESIVSRVIRNFGGLTEAVNEFNRQVQTSGPEARNAINEFDDSILSRRDDLEQYARLRYQIAIALHEEEITAREAETAYRALADAVREISEPQNVEAQERLMALRAEVSLLGETETAIASANVERERERMLAEGVNSTLADQISSYESVLLAADRLYSVIDSGNVNEAAQAWREFRDSFAGLPLRQDYSLSDLFGDMEEDLPFLERLNLVWARLNDTLSTQAFIQQDLAAILNRTADEVRDLRANAVDELISSMQEQEESIFDEIRAIEMSESAYLRYTAVQEAMNFARENSIRLTETEIGKIEELADRLAIANREREKAERIQSIQNETRDFMSIDEAMGSLSGFSGELAQTLQAQEQYQDNLQAIAVLVKADRLNAQQAAQAYRDLGEAYAEAMDPARASADERIRELRDEIAQIGLSEDALADFNREQEIAALRAEGVSNAQLENIDILIRIRDEYASYTRAIEANDQVAAAAAEAELRRLYAMAEATDSVFQRTIDWLSRLAEHAGPVGAILQWIASLLSFISRTPLPDLPDLETTLGNIRAAASDGGQEDPFEEWTTRIREQTESLRIEADVIGMTASAAARYAAEQELLNILAEEDITLTAQQVELRNQLLDNLQAQTAELERRRAIEDFDEGISALQDELFLLQQTSILGESRADQLAEELNLRRELRDAELTPEEIEQRVKQWRALSDQIEVLNSAIERQRQMADDLGKAFYNAFSQAIIRGEDLREVLANLALQIAEIYFQQSLFSAGANLIGNFLSGLGPGGGVGGGFIGVQALNPIAVGHTGGVVGNLPVSRPGTFIGSLGPDEQPIIAKKGELLLDPSSVGTNSGGETFNINNYITIQGNVGPNGLEADAMAQLQRQLEENIKTSVRNVIVLEKRPGGMLSR